MPAATSGEEEPPRAARHTTLDIRCYVAEALGTAILVLVGCGSAIVAQSTHAFGHAGVSLAFGLVVAFLVASLGTISGAHINPAVTLAFWSLRRFPTRHVAPYILAQCIGAVLASFALQWLLGTASGHGATVLSVSPARAFAIEAGFSGILALVIFAVATDERISKTIVPFVIGATVFAGALVTGPLTGGSFNPARSLGPAIAGNIWTAHWIYWLAPVGGMLVMARVYEFLRGAEPPDAAPRDIAMGVEGPI